MLSFLIHQSQNSYVILLWVDYTRPAQNFISFLEGFCTKYTYGLCYHFVMKVLVQSILVDFAIIL